MNTQENIVNNYSRAIDLLMDNAVDYRKIVIELAKVNPGLFVELATRNAPTPAHLQWHRKVHEHILQDEMVSAIKLVREKKSLGLKEAKDICDSLRNVMYQRGMPVREAYGSPVLRTDLQQILNEIIKSLPA